MPLDRAKKSVLFHQGMSDGTDRFLLEPPSLDYAENLRIDKQGSLQKRPGFGPSELTTVPNTNGDPFFIHAIGNTLHALTEDGARSYNGSSWSETDVGGFLGSQDIIVDAPPVGGMGHVDILPYYLSGELVNYVVVYEVREESTSDAASGHWESTPKHVVISTFSSDGSFLYQTRIDDARSPKVFMHPNQTGFPNAVVVMYQPTTGTYVLHSSLYYPLTGTVVGAFSSGVSVSPTFGMECHASLIPHDTGGRISPMWYTRLGASSDGHARYHIAVDTDNERLIILYQEDGGVKLSRLNDNLLGEEQGLNFAPASSVARHEALDIIYTSTNVIHIMFARYEPTDPRLSQVTVQRRVSTGTFTQEWTRDVRTDTAAGTDFYPRTYTHGCLAKKPGSTTLSWMVHDSGQAVGFDPEEPNAYPEPGGNQESVRDRNTGIHHGRLTDTRTAVVQLGTDRMLPHHRLASRCFWFEDELYACVQQWSDHTPYTDNIGFNWDQEPWPSVLGATFPRSTILASFNQDANIVRPVGVFDSGMSRLSEYAESEFQTHLPSVYLDDGDIILSNRVVLTAEDLSMKWGFQGATPQWVRLGASEHPADATCRIYRVSKGAGGANGISVAPMGDGVFIGAAAPLWFDGRFFGEVGPLDKPEIIDVRDSRMEDTESPDTPDPTPPRCRINYDGVDKNQTTDGAWRKLQVVVGYHDSSGNKHRSSPSSTVYVDSISVKGNGTNDPDTTDSGSYPSNWRGKEVTVYFTLPLSFLPSDLEYFVEVYASDDSDDDPVLIDTSTIDMSTTPAPDDVSITVQLVRWVSRQPGDIIFQLPRRTASSVYTAGGDLAADPWPAFTKSVVTSTRLWTIDAINKGRVIPSKLFEDFISPEYNGTLAINLGDERNLTAIGKLDDKVVVFEPDDIHIIYGDGPDNRGQGQDFAVHYIATDVGCEDQESIIETPAGLIFYSNPRGFYLLDRNYQIQFIGSGVEDLARDIDIVAATLVRDKAEVRFVFTGGTSFLSRWGPASDTDLVARPPLPVFTNAAPLNGDSALSYNYERGTWMVFTNYDAAAATMYQGKYTMLLNNWDIWQESETRFDDPTGLNKSSMTTPWIRLSEQVQGFNRLWKMTFLGRYMSSLQDLGTEEYEAGDVVVKVYYDYESEASQTEHFPFQDFGYDPFNNPPKRAERFQFEIEPSRGRCQAVKLRIYEIASEDRGEGLTYKQGHGFEIVSVDFDIGVSTMRTLIPAGVKQ